MADVELVVIDRETRLRELLKELRWNEAYYLLAKGLYRTPEDSTSHADRSRVPSVGPRGARGLSQS